METLVRIFMRRDKLTRTEAVGLVKEMRERVSAGEDPEDVLYDECLEPDYIFDLLLY